MELRPYQRAIVEAARRKVAGGVRRLLVVAPTGAGKTVILAQNLASFLQRNEGGKSAAIYVVHRRQLVEQTHAVLERIGVPASIIMAGYETDWSKRVYVISRDTLWRRRDFIHLGRVRLAIFDEAHIAVEMQKRLIEEFEPEVVLGYTATPLSLSGPGMGYVYQDIVVGPTYRELIEMGHLVPTRFIAYEPHPELLKLRVGADGEWEKRELLKLLRRGDVLADPLQAYLEHIQDELVVWFAPSVDIAVGTAERLGAGGIRAAVISWQTPERERHEILRDFRAGKIRVLVNVDVFSEGIDIPEVGAIVLASPTRSLARYLQRVGRGMRPHPGKRWVKVVDLVGAVYLHGVPEAIEGWGLEPARPNRKAADQYALVKRRPLCPKCRAEMRGRSCPECGWRPEPSYAWAWYNVLPGKPVEAFELGGEAQKRLFFAGLLWYALRYGKKPGFAAHLYREKYGGWPPKEWYGLQPVEYQPAINWVKAYFIRQKAQREKVWASIVRGR